MDQSTRDSLKSLDFALQQSVVKPKQEDEFTMEDYIRAAREINQDLSSNGLRAKLQRMTNDGLFTSRKIILAGKQVNVYKRAS